jgi:hypothetical protein
VRRETRTYNKHITIAPPTLGPPLLGRIRLLLDAFLSRQNARE